jgi:hypothetical protein
MVFRGYLVVKEKILHLEGKEFKLSSHSSVGIALGYGLDDRGSRIRFPAGAGNFSLHHHVQNGSYRGGKADHSPPTSAEVNE